MYSMFWSITFYWVQHWTAKVYFKVWCLNPRTVSQPKPWDLEIIERVSSAVWDQPLHVKLNCFLQASSECFKNSGSIRSLLSGQCFTSVLFQKWELFAFLLRCVLIFTRARALCIAAFNYVCFVKAVEIMAAFHFCTSPAFDGGYLWTAAFLELLLCIDQPAFVISTCFMSSPFCFQWELSEVLAFGMAEKQTHRDVCVMCLYLNSCSHPCSVSCLVPE